MTTALTTTRSLRGRYVLIAQMRLATPLAIGSAMTSGLIDGLFITDGLGRPVIPGTTLAGVIGHELDRERNSGPDGLGELFGGSDDGDAASRLIVDDAIVQFPNVEVRTGVGIDRFSGTSAPNVLYNREVIAAGSTLEIRCEILDDGLDGTVEDTAERRAAQLAAQVAGLFRRGFSVGSATSTGFGRLELVDDHALDVSYDDLASPEGIVAFLDPSRTETDRSRDAVAAVLSRAEPAVGRARWTLAIDWEPVLPILVRDAEPGEVIGSLPLVTRSASDSEKVQFVIPGSSIKGVLRSRAEHIVRTVAPHVSEPARGRAVKGDEFIEQIDVPLVTALFGRAADTKHDTLGRGAVTIRGVRSIAEFPHDMWADLRTMTEPKNGPYQGGFPPELHQQLRKLEQSAGLPARSLLPASHVAVDRWTNSTVDRALFSALEIRDVDWAPITISVDLQRLEAATASDDAQRSANDYGAALFLLLLVVRDLVDGWIPLGHATHRGHGSIRLRPEPGCGVTFSVWQGSSPDLTSSLPADGTVGLAELPGLDVTELEGAWTDWIATQGGKR